MYSGRCFKRCPDGTYASEILRERSSRRRNLTYFSEGVVTKRQDGASSAQTALEALDMEPSANISTTPLTCLLCHYTCATCMGPHHDQCLSCLDDAYLYNDTDTEPKFYCYSNTIVSQLKYANWHYKVNIILSVLLVGIISISLYVVISYFIKKWCCGGYYHSNMAYNKLAVDDKQQSALEIEEEIHNALKDCSESESDDDLHL